MAWGVSVASKTNTTHQNLDNLSPYLELANVFDKYYTHLLTPHAISRFHGKGEFSCESLFLGIDASRHNPGSDLK